jgi:hypothetical protein
MYVWEMVSARLRREGWFVWHATESRDVGDEPTYRVHVARSGLSYTASGPTLTDAYAAAARRARESAGPSRGLVGACG